MAKGGTEKFQHRITVTPDMKEHSWFAGKSAPARQREMFHCFRVGWLVVTGQFTPTGNVTASPASSGPQRPSLAAPPVEEAEDFAMEFAGICQPAAAGKPTLN